MKSIVVQGQLSLFDEPDNVISTYTTKEEKKDNIIYSELIDKYKDKCTRIAMVEKKLYIEINNETLSFEPTGKPSGTFIKDMHLRPKDEILVANEYKPITDKQINTLRKIHTDKFIKRKSDTNLLIQYENFCIAIYPSGKFAKWKSPAIYKDDEIFSIDEIENINKRFEEIKEDHEELKEIKLENESFEVGDRVKFNYNGLQVGKITRIYNAGETVNISWNNKSTAFYYKNVEKIKV